VTTEQPNQTTYAARRAAMADETRVRILDACVAILARGVAELSIPAVAREAGVSVPTVYRNFADKKTLVAATAEHLRKQRGAFSPPTHVSGLAQSVRDQFRKSASMNETVRAALTSEPILAARRDSGEHARRIHATEVLLGELVRELPVHDRDHAVRMITVLCSSATLQAFRTVIGATPDEAAETALWAIARLLGRDSLDSEPTTRKAKGSKR
jgi:AcrR family transcriptional regulator